MIVFFQMQCFLADRILSVESRPNEAVYKNNVLIILMYNLMRNMIHNTCQRLI